MHGIIVLVFSKTWFCMAGISSTSSLKSAVQNFWDADPCGSRYLGTHHDFEAHARTRYAFEPFIPDFAQFAKSRGLRVLEIGVGMGADYLEWLKAGAVATGVDLSQQSLEIARNRCATYGYTSDLHLADAESLPFPDASFDIVYSYGVMHHSPDTQRCIREAFRVLKSGGEARIMIYHHPSLTGILLWLRYGVFRKSLRRAVYEHLESPGTKSYTRAEAQTLMGDFESVRIQIVFSPGDLLLNAPSPRFQAPVYRAIWKLYPRRLVRTLGKRLGLFLLIRAKKPNSSRQ
jgi:SAM-dependent methyltransferase